MTSSPLQSLDSGTWFKLICGASFQDLGTIRNLSLVYALAGADCVDVAAEPAALWAARDGLAQAANLAKAATQRGFSVQRQPWLMVSLNDGEDPHFRKAYLETPACPPDCSRPCAAVCPADAIVFSSATAQILSPLCYGCGRCLPVCPSHLIGSQTHVVAPQALLPWLSRIDALEIHTQVGREAQFSQLWATLAPHCDRLKLLAISCPDGADLIAYLCHLWERLQPLPCPLVWQADGRPMSGDLGMGATRAAVKLAQKILAANLPGYVQLAGGTNDHTVSKLNALGLIAQPSRRSPLPTIAGVAYGSYARSAIAPLLKSLNETGADTALENYPELLWQAVGQARRLVGQLKGPWPGASHDGFSAGGEGPRSIQ